MLGSGENTRRDDFDSPFGCEQYLFGLPQVGVRKIIGPELEELKRYADRLFIYFALWLLLGPVLVVSVVVPTVYLMWTGSSSLGSDDLVMILVLSLVYLPVSMYFFLKAHRNMKAVNDTVKAGTVRVFRGRAEGFTLAAFKESKALPGKHRVTPGRETTVELHHSADFLYGYEGARINRFRKLELTRAAKVPDDAPLTPVEDDDGGEFLVRQLNIVESREMRGYSLGRIRPYAFFMYLAVCAFLGKFLKKLTDDTSVTLVFSIIFLVGLAAAVIIDVRRYLKLKADRQVKFVLVVSKEEMLRTDPDFKFQNPALTGSEYVEVLPNTGLVWREGREPAPWRDGCK